MRVRPSGPNPIGESGEATLEVLEPLGRAAGLQRRQLGGPADVELREVKPNAPGTDRPNNVPRGDSLYFNDQCDEAVECELGVEM